MKQPDSGATSASTRDPVEELAEVFLDRYRRGERPSLTEFTARAPEHAKEIRELFPALVLLEQAIPVNAAAAAHPHRAMPLERLGDYRVIREIGRGGMGIVYEAEQEALGRHVALKVLPISPGVDSQGLLRFRREARSAARLHHTNIVPVFDIGERDGVHYYAMQFIQGQSLDAVITELRRLRSRGSQQNGPPAAEDQAVQTAAASLAGGLVSGQFHGEDLLRDAASAPTDEGTGSAAVSTSSILKNTSDFSAKSDFHFYRSVARIGLQVAEALAYAHGQRIWHRDIKPANLLLDARGTIWVTDFGLAKEEGGDVTRTGEVVGTLRYMAPERLNGVSDARSDIYSLGLTLYEILTLRPAFPEADRARLVQAIAHREPGAPRKIDSRIPRDLETIVLKAITKEPAGRYAAAEDVAEDLRRFLADRPIRARRVSSWERVRRWCRRNPGWAATIASVLGLLLVMAVGGTLLSLHLQRALNDLQIADEEKSEKLWQSYLERARALRSSGRVGQRFEALKAIREAAKVKITDELRDEAVAALVLPDAEIAREWEGCPEGTVHCVHDAAFERYARIDKKGEITVCRLTTAGEEILARLPIHGAPPFFRLWMSPDGRFVAYGYSSPREGQANAVRVWQLDGERPTVFLDEPRGIYLEALTFHANGRWLAIGHRDNFISVYDLRNKEAKPRRLNIGQVANSLAFHPNDGLLAAACGNAVRVIDVGQRKQRALLQVPKIQTWSYGLAWHPGGRLLATTCDDAKIYIWDTHTSSLAMPPLEGHTSMGVHMAFNHVGDRLISQAWDNQTRLWDAVTGRQLLTMPTLYGGTFSPDDSLIGFERIDNKLRLWRLADGRELRTIRRAGADRWETIHSAVLDADGEVLATGSNQGLTFFEFETGKELATVRFYNANTQYPLGFHPRDGWNTCGHAGEMLWPLRRDPSRPDIRHVGPPRRLAYAVEPGSDASSDGRIRAIPQGQGALVLDRDRPGWQMELGPQHDVRYCAVSPDGRLVVTCSWWVDINAKSVRIWEAETGKHVADLPLQGSSRAQFSPDGRWLATHTGGYEPGHGTQLWEVGTWRVGQRFKSHGCFSADGKLLSVHDMPSVIRLVEPSSSKELIRLTGPEATIYQAVSMTPDGTRLIASVSGTHALYVWDLSLIRKELRALGMDWKVPDFTPARRPATSNLTMKLDPGLFRRPVFEDDGVSVAVFSVSLALQPMNPEAYLQRGLAYERLGPPAKCVADYQAFLALAPMEDQRRPEIQLRVAKQYFDGLRNVPAAITHLLELAKLPKEEILWPEAFASQCNSVGWKLVTQPKTSELTEAGVILLRKAVELQPYSLFYQNTLGSLLMRARKYEEAIACLEKNLEQSRRFAAFDLYVLAICHERLGQREKSRACYDRANAAVQAETRLSAGHRQELEAFRAEVESLFRPGGRN